MIVLNIDNKALQTLFPLSSYEKGRTYYNEGKVKTISVHQISFNQEAIIATVQGNKLYNVRITLETHKNNITIDGKCSCPLHQQCKHIIASMLKAQNNLMDKKNAIENANIDRWLNQLNNAINTKTTTNDVVSDQTYSLHYLLSSSSNRTNRLVITPTLVRQLKRGGYGAESRYSTTAISQQRYLQPIDHELIMKLEVSNKIASKNEYHYDRNSYLLSDKKAEVFFPELIATKRCHFSSSTNPLLTIGPPLRGEIRWHMDEEGFQEPRCYTDEGPISVFCIDQLWYYDNTTWKIGPLETDCDKNVVNNLMTAPKIPPNLAAKVAVFLDKHEITKSIIKPTSLERKVSEDITPTPRLHLGEKPMKISGDYKNGWQTTIVNKPFAKLAFDYLGELIPWNDQRSRINQIKNNTLTQIVRNHSNEKGAFYRLMDTNLKLLKFHDDLSRNNPDLSDYFVFDPNLVDPLDFTLNIVPSLRSEGWQVTMDENYPYKVISDPIDEWYSSIDENSGYDWFGLELGIKVNNECINLLPVLQKLLKEMGVSKQKNLSEDKPLYAQLPNGNYIQLPTDRIKNILSVLIELHDANSLSNDSTLHLSKLHAARLVELEKAFNASQLRWHGGEKLRALGEKLTQFKGIIPVQAPIEFKGELRAYQLEGLSWLQFLREYEFGGILADDMGLGKTVQALSHIALEKSSGRMTLPSLIVAPTSLMFNWRLETERFYPQLKLVVLHGSDRKFKFDSITNYDVILTTYPLLVRDKNIFLQHQYHLLILDEAQFIKNSKSLASHAAIQLKAKHRVCLTGTPMENHLGELWSLFHFMMPGLLGEEAKFRQLFRTPIEKWGDHERRQHLSKRIAPFLLRRTKDDVVKELPEKIETIHHIELDGAQRDLYETIRITMQKKVREQIASLGLSRSHIIILDALLKLRQICCDPRLLKVDTTKGKKLKSAKLEFLIPLLNDLLQEGRRILLFSQFTGMLSLIEDELNKNKIEYVKLTGKTIDRETPIREFQEKKVPLFLISLKAGGTGLNLTSADTVIHYDPWWNPAVENQATDRAHRIGQTKTVFVYKLVAQGTVEEKILEMQKNKKALMDGLFSEKSSGKSKLTEEDLSTLFDPLE